MVNFTTNLIGKQLSERGVEWLAATGSFGATEVNNEHGNGEYEPDSHAGGGHVLAYGLSHSFLDGGGLVLHCFC